MTASDAEAWARLRLVQGRSSAELWELVSARGHTLLTVGASPGCNWVVQEHGVAPVHFSLHWDGAVLRIADSHGAGNVRVDGAPVGAAFLVLSGRARIDFGQAAMVVETSSGSVAELGHPLDRMPPLSVEARRTSTNPPSHSEHAARPAPKATLLGVAPLTAHGTPILASVPTKTPPPAAAPAPMVSEQTDSFRPKRAGESVRAPKPTLLGMAHVTSSAAPVDPAPTPAGGRPTASNLNQTLLGVGQGGGTYGSSRPSQRVAGASLAEGDQRTMPGFPSVGGPSERAVTVSVGGSTSSVPPGRRETQRGVVSVPPGVVPGAVAQARVRPISDPVPPARTPDAARFAPSRPLPMDDEDAAPTEVMDDPFQPPSEGPVPQAVLIGSAMPRDEYAAGGDRLSDAPTEMRDLSSLESRRPRKPFPWHYAFVGVLTVLAYVAWLYLLDHL